MTYMSDLLSTLFERRYAAADRKDTRPIAEMCRDLLTRQGEVSGVYLAHQILDRYALMNDAEKHAMFSYLASDLGLEPDAIEAALACYRKVPDGKNFRKLMQVAEPRRQELARRLNQVPGATEKLVKMRADLMRFAKHDPALEPVNIDLQYLFASWFNRGFLVLRPINWQSPANILEKIIAYEAVHAIDSWEDLRRRVEPEDRRCFAFFHPSMPEEPLIFVEVALTKGIPNSIQTLLAEDRNVLQQDQADTAVFYSISNCQKGLAGISFGNSLIKQVVEFLSLEMPGLKTFVTLSPIPGLQKWLHKNGFDETQTDPDGRAAVAAHYLLTAKDANGLPLNPVTRFHLYNGAMIHDIHPQGDISANGMAQSGGAMVNYLYDLKRISKNHESLATDHKMVVSKRVKTLARQALRMEKAAASPGSASPSK